MFFHEDIENLKEVAKKAANIVKREFNESLPKSNCLYASLNRAAEDLPLDYQMVLVRAGDKYRCFGGAKKIYRCDNTAECYLAGAKAQFKEAWLIAKTSARSASVTAVSAAKKAEKFEIRLQGDSFSVQPSRLEKSMA